MRGNNISVTRGREGIESADITRRDYVEVVGAATVLPSSVTRGLFTASNAPTATEQWSVSFTTGKDANVRTVDDGNLYVDGTELNVLSASDGTVQWSFTDTEGDVEVASIRDGVVYLDDARHVHALDAADGTERWRAESVTLPTVTAETVYAHGPDGLVALSTAGGNERWRYESGAKPLSSPLSAGGTVYAGSTSGTLYALDGADGTERWQFTAGEDSFVHPIRKRVRRKRDASDRESVFAWNSSSGELYAVDTDDGTERWRFAIGDSPATMPGVVADDAVLVADGSELFAFETTDGTERWRATVSGDSATVPRLADGTVYVGSSAGVHAVSASDGREQWTSTVGTDAAPTVVGADDEKVAVVSRDSVLSVLSATDGSVRWRYEFEDGHAWYPKMDGGTVYAGTRSGRVYALGAPSTTETGTASTAVVNSPGFPVAIGGLSITALLALAYYRLKGGSSDE